MSTPVVGWVLLAAPRGRNIDRTGRAAGIARPKGYF
jgi:hypothetical protein